MMKDNQKMLKRVYVLMDACIIVIAYLLAYYIRFSSPLAGNLSILKVEPGVYYPLVEYSERLIFLVPLYLFVYFIFHLYTPKRGKRKGLEVLTILLANLFGIAVFFCFLYIMKEYNFSRKFLAIFFVLNITLSTVTRMMLNKIKIPQSRGQYD